APGGNRSGARDRETRLIEADSPGGSPTGCCCRTSSAAAAGPCHRYSQHEQSVVPDRDGVLSKTGASPPAAIRAAACVRCWFCYAATVSPTTFCQGGPMRRHALRWMCAVTALLALHCGRSKSTPGGSESENKPPPRAAGTEPAGSAAPTKLTVAAIAIVDVAPLYLAKAKGFFSEQNLDVTIQNTQGGAQSVPGVVSGQYQFGFANIVSLLLASSKGLPLKVIAAGNFSTGKPEDFGGVVVPAKSPVKTMKDLEGKTLSVN